MDKEKRDAKWICIRYILENSPGTALYKHGVNWGLVNANWSANITFSCGLDFVRVLVRRDDGKFKIFREPSKEFIEFVTNSEREEQHGISVDNLTNWFLIREAFTAYNITDFSIVGNDNKWDYVVDNVKGSILFRGDIHDLKIIVERGKIAKEFGGDDDIGEIARFMLEDPDGLD